MSYYNVKKENAAHSIGRQKRSGVYQPIRNYSCSQRIRVKIEDTDLFLVGLMIDKSDLKERLREEAEIEGITDISFLIKVIED